jgi:hypothetical protein
MRARQLHGPRTLLDSDALADDLNAAMDDLLALPA